jgi:hypothetical protein
MPNSTPALDAVLGPSEGPTSAPNPDPAPPTAGEAAVAAARNATEAIDQELTAIFKLRGGGQWGTLGSGPVIDETTYQAAKPAFQAAWQSAKAAGGNLSDFINVVVRRAQEAYGPQWGQYKDVLRAMLRRFAQEMRTATQAGRRRDQATECVRPASTGKAIGTLTQANLVTEGRFGSAPPQSGSTRLRAGR